MKPTKLPSGNFRIKVYDYTDSAGKKHYQSFTASTKKEVERLANNYKYNRNKNAYEVQDITVEEAVSKYIELQRPLLSPTTIHAYERYKQYAFQDLMMISIKKLDNLMLRQAVADESSRITSQGKQISAKSVKNEYFLISAALNIYAPDLDTKVPLPRVPKKIVELPTPEEVFEAVKGSSIELPVLLAMWLSFSVSEIKGLKRSSIYGNYLQIDQVMVRVGKEHIEKELAKVDTRTRRHRIPPYIGSLIALLPKSQEYLVPETANTLNSRLDALLKEHNVRHISFHKLRHINASTMALLQIPDKYAQERGGWSTDSTMKNVYQHTFSEERVLVDDKIDDYFNEIVGVTPSDKKINYPMFLKVLNLKETESSKKLFDDYKKI